jgi:hypothetical protein
MEPVRSFLARWVDEPVGTPGTERRLAGDHAAGSRGDARGASLASSLHSKRGVRKTCNLGLEAYGPSSLGRTTPGIFPGWFSNCYH